MLPSYFCHVPFMKILTSCLLNSMVFIKYFETIWLFFLQARRICGTTHFICLCTNLHFGLPPNFEDCKDWANMNPHRYLRNRCSAWSCYFLLFFSRTNYRINYYFSQGKLELWSHNKLQLTQTLWKLKMRCFHQYQLKMTFNNLY